MEAFTAITLFTKDAVLAAAIPAQLRHLSFAACAVEQDWHSLRHNLAQHPPALLLLDCAGDTNPQAIAALRRDHPLMALVGIGTPEEAGHFAPLPLSAFVKRPVSMPALVRSVEHLGYQRAMSAGQQRLAFPQAAGFLPADKRIETQAGAAIELTDKESALLLCLYHHRHGWLPRQQLLEEVWGYSDAIATHTLETHLYRLRGKLREAFDGQELITTRNGTYQLRL